jgi:hypothetical protein
MGEPDPSSPRRAGRPLKFRPALRGLESCRPANPGLKPRAVQSSPLRGGGGRLAPKEEPGASSGRSAATPLLPPQPDPLCRSVASGRVGKVLHRNLRRSTATPPFPTQRMPTLRQRAGRTATVLDPPQRKRIGRKSILSTATWSAPPHLRRIHRELPRFAATERNPPRRNPLHRNVPISTATGLRHRNVCRLTATQAYPPRHSDLHRNSPCYDPLHAVHRNLNRDRERGR